MKHSDYLAKILDALAQKYGKEFEILWANYEFDGASGNFYRVGCREKGRKEIFLAKYYLRGTDSLLAWMTDGPPEGHTGKPELQDSYCNLLLNIQTAEYLVAENPDVLFAIADIGVSGHVITMEDLKDGVTAFLAAKGASIRGGIWLFVSNQAADRENLENELVSGVLSLRMEKQNIRIAYVSPSVLGAMKEEYGSDTDRLDDRLKAETRVSRYCRYTTCREDGVVARHVIKEG